MSQYVIQQDQYRIFKTNKVGLTISPGIYLSFRRKRFTGSRGYRWLKILSWTWRYRISEKIPSDP